ncbi:MAG TPA: anion transporter [Chthonomonadaceae bacterium]|nr:anion transporter [Chthonomonadaceae bacterium]
MGIHSVLAIAIFVLVYLIILAGEESPRKLDRPAAGLLGGVLMVLSGVLTRAEALAAIDFATLALLLGMMMVIHYATASGLLDWLARSLVRRSYSPRQLLWTVCLAAGILSALFVNDTICLLMTPLLLTATRRARLPAEPYLLALATSSNAGSVMTLTGNPQNMLIGQSSGWSWGAFALRMVPVGLVCLAINGVVVSRIYGRQLKAASLQHAGGAEALPQAALPLDRKLAAKTLVVLAGLLIAFLFGAPMDLAALTAAVVILILANRPPQETFAWVDWSLLLFFAGLFVVVEGVTKTQGVWIARLVPALTHHKGRLGELTWFSLASVAGSNLFSNVPFVMLLRGWIAHLPRAPLLWLALSASSTLAGNLTLVGSVANLVVAQGAREECPLSFWTFLRVGVPSTLLTALASVLMLWLYGLLHWA